MVDTKATPWYISRILQVLWHGEQLWGKNSQRFISKSVSTKKQVASKHDVSANKMTGYAFMEQQWQESLRIKVQFRQEILKKFRSQDSIHADRSTIIKTARHSTTQFISTAFSRILQAITIKLSHGIVRFMPIALQPS